MSGILHAPFMTLSADNDAYSPTTVSLSFLQNDLDFKRVPIAGNGTDQISALIRCDTANAFMQNLTAHYLVSFDVQGGQGEGGSFPHCGPIYRDGRNLWAFARGAVYDNQGRTAIENWNGTSSPNVTNLTPTSSSFTANSPTYLHVVMDYGEGFMRVDTWRGLEGSMQDLYGHNVVYINSSSPYYRAAPVGGNNAFIGAINSPFQPPTPQNGCTEPTRTGANRTANFTAVSIIRRNRKARPARFWRAERMGNVAWYSDSLSGFATDGSSVVGTRPNNTAMAFDFGTPKVLSHIIYSHPYPASVPVNATIGTSFSDDGFFFLDAHRKSGVGAETRLDFT